MGASRGPCFLGCGRPAADTHHIYPREYGGADSGPKVHLCKDCHNGVAGVHALAEQVWQHRRTLESLGGDQHLLVKAILQQRQEFARTGVAPDARRRVVAELTVEQQQDLRLLKQHLGCANQEEVLIQLITTAARALKNGRLPRG